MRLHTIYSEAAAEIVCKPYLVGEDELGRLAQQSSCDFLKFLESKDLDMKSTCVLEILSVVTFTIERKFIHNSNNDTHTETAHDIIIFRTRFETDMV